MFQNNKKHKIALVGDSLDSGGAEKVHALLSHFFFNHDFEVYNIIILDSVSYHFSGNLLNLGLLKSNIRLLQKTKRFFALKKHFDSHSFDVIIDFRMRTSINQEFLLSHFVYPKNTFYTIHSAILNYYLPSNITVAKAIYNAKNLVSVSNSLKKVIAEKYNFSHLFQIYNPLDFKEIEHLQNDFQVNDSKYILAVGRMNDAIKQFDQLIVAYSKSILPQKGIKLLFLGDGENKEKLKALASELNLNELIQFENFVKNPFPYYKSAFFTVLSSKNEGFPNVLIESLAVETPVISFDCFSGPSEIIEQHQNGILVKNQDFDALKSAMNELVTNEMMYSICKKNAKESVRKFDVEIIGQQWLHLIKNVVS
jgi:N-acetylgalactosamine-N,N'-diacetylbacillosaminyl-diphospho-undecaprenol 4-alpha-N-acetylgalactosaminyltransferase